jgi:pyruvate dehydrogenase E2 component (dihydrolipoamide acetyltransferase)
MTEIVIPSMGIAMEEALIVRWLKGPGEPVGADEPVVEIETDKATMDIVSPIAGTLGPHLFEAGTVAPVGATIVVVLSQVDAASAVPAHPHEPMAEAAAVAGGDPDPASAGEAAPAANGSAEGAELERKPHALSPRARRLARERETSRTVEAPDSAAPALPGGRFRELIAAKVSESWHEIPHFTVSREIDAEEMAAALDRERGRGLDPAPTLTDLLLRALAQALRDTGTSGQVDVGLAVASPDGVVIPVVQDVLGRSLSGLAAARQEAVARGRAGRLSKEDVSTVPPSTLSNLGSFGVDRFTGIVALGQTTLLTVGRVRPRVVADDRRAITVRLMFDATLNADHRAVDGADAARLLAAFALAAETPPQAL